MGLLTQDVKRQYHCLENWLDDEGQIRTAQHEDMQYQLAILGANYEQKQAHYAKLEAKISELEAIVKSLQLNLK